MSSLQVLAARSLQGDGRCNEDRVGSAPGAAWVIDGATGVGRDLVGDGSDAAWFAAAVDRALREALATGPEVATPDLLRAVVGAVALRFDAERIADPDGHHELLSAAFVLARVSGEAIELSALGDCRAVYAAPGLPTATFGTDGVGRFEAETLAELAALYAADPLLEVTAAKALILPRLRANRAFMNRPDGYWVLSIDPSAIDALHCVTIERGGPLELLLASDGFLRLDDLFRVVDAEGMLAADDEQAIDRLLQTLRGLETADAGCRRHVRAKVSDDASVLRARFAL